MKKLQAILLGVVLTFACATFLGAATLTVQLTYTYSTTTTVDANGNWPACSATVKSTCINGFKVYQSDVTPFVAVGTINNAATPSGTQTFSQDLTDSSLSYGAHAIEATTLYIDSSGAAKETTYSASAPFVYDAGVPATVVIKSVTAK
ncbi:MAG: hypothetical protein KGI66_00635 [Patescibacteria group bacterium]|nr:hypothetical protein [Patescibacteria group bacterium]